MKILLIGNYIHGRSQSMLRFGNMLQNALQEAGHEVRLVRPEPIVGCLKSGEDGIGKWLGYIDRFVLFRPRLVREIEWADVVHICDQANSVYVPVLKAKPHIVTCHDMLAIRSALGEIPCNRTRWTGRVYQRWILRGLRETQHVACVSAQTRDELLRVAGLPSERVSVVPNALNYPYRPMAPTEARERLWKLGLSGQWRYFLHVGGNQWYKNREGVVRIFHRLAVMPRFEWHHLVMAGKSWTQDMRKFVQQSGLGERIHELTDVTNEDLRALYSLSDTLIFPSLQEGFGWPIIEAQACGCPVVTSNIAPMTEVGGNGAVYINPREETAAASIIADIQDRLEPVRLAGFANAARFSLESMTSGYLGAYCAVLNGSKQKVI